MTIQEIKTQTEYDQALDNNEGLLVALFTAPSWCGPCRAFEPQYNKVAQLTDATLLRVDVDDNPWTLDEGIRAVPTIKLYRGNEFLRNLSPAEASVFADSITE